MFYGTGTTEDNVFVELTMCLCQMSTLDRQTDQRQTDRQRDRQTDRETDTERDRHRDRQTDRQTDKPVVIVARDARCYTNLFLVTPTIAYTAALAHRKIINN